tara:strand:+ start:2562 stop:3308 length:747 start_codon:yes stop_codon:yes gene_type:complete
MSGCSAPSGGLRKQIVSQLCVLNISNTSQPLIKFFAKKNEISKEKTVNHKDEILKKLKENSNLSQGQTVLGNITKRSSKIINHLDDRKVKAVFSDISIVNDGIMKKVNEQEREEMIQKISAMTVGMDPLTVKKLFEEIENRNNEEIDPIELAKIKQLITNMFDYKTSLPSSASSANSPANMAASIASKAAEKVKENVKSAFANKLGSFNPSDQQKEIIKKVASTSFKGGRKTPNNKQRHNKTKKKKQY